MNPAPATDAPVAPLPRARDYRPMRIVHEGRGGYIELDDRRYPIEHIEGGRFAIHYTAGKRPNPEHLPALQRLVDTEPDKWAIESRGRGQGPK